ncbi:uncharacterized protein LOC143179645 [Calliopsis andreniformis]|uniref:uncharacterized protein LOC143179645 n=1 Tax=Calliopsis andreniformis TaxID=337506 RepID=UPI003FCC7BE2
MFAGDLGKEGWKMVAAWNMNRVMEHPPRVSRGFLVADSVEGRHETWRRRPELYPRWCKAAQFRLATACGVVEGVGALNEPGRRIRGSVRGEIVGGEAAIF